MAYTSLSRGIVWPFDRHVGFTGTGGTMDAANERIAFIGRLHINGRSGSKTIDTTGSSSIGFMPGAVTFANGSTTIVVGIQGVGTGGPVAQPNGTFGAQVTMTGGVTTLTANTWKEIAPTSGTSTLSHGDLVAVVFDMTGRGGADSVVIAGGHVGGALHAPFMFPCTNVYIGGAWGTANAGYPMVSITFSDGTLGTIHGTPFAGLTAARIWSDATNPDERGNIFQVPFACKVEGIWGFIRTVDNTSDHTFSLFSTPEGTPALMDSVAVDAAQLSSTANEGLAYHLFDAEVELSKDTDYCVAVRATGAGNIRFNEMACTGGVAGHRVLWYPAGTTLRSVTRDGGSGAFGSSDTQLYNPIGVLISAIDFPAGGGGLLTHPGYSGRV